MAYRGEDLDLRTPQSRGGRDVGGDSGGNGGLNGARQRQPSSGNGRSETMYVDETVLACCNHAFGIAQAHGASEVRLEHLVHALTRVETAAGILEDRGIREAHLRRESAAVIASEIPVGLSHSHSAPRASAELADVLSRASDLAGRRGAPASVHELLWVLLNYDRDIPAIGLLLRHAADWQNWDWPHERERTPTPPYFSERVPPPPRPRPVETRVEPVVTQPVYVPSVSAPNLDPVNSRLDQMDGALRRLQSDMANDRRVVTDMLRDLQRDLVALRNAPSGAPAGMMDRLQSIETVVDRRFQEFGRTAATLTERLQSLEKSVLSGASMNGGGDVSGLTDLVTEQFVAVSDRLKAVEDGMTARRQGDGELRSLVERMGAGGNGSAAGLQALRQVLDEQKLALPSLVASVTEPLTERVRAMEMLLQSRGSDQASAERLARVEQTLATTAQSIASAGAATVDMAERVKRLEVQLAQRAGAESQQAQLFAQGVQTLSAKMTQVEGLVQSHGDRSVKYAQQLAQQAAETQQRELTQLHEQLVTLGGNQKTLAESLDQWRADSEGGLSIVANRIDQIEKVVTAPMGLLKQVQSDLQNLQQVTLADYDQNRKGIRNWLFGTDDIFATTWRDETRQIRDRLKQLREERRA
jgi:hypothetical protein